MPHFRRNLFDELEDMQRQMDRFLVHFTTAKRPICLYSPTAWQPAVDVYESATEVVVVVELAGMDQDSLEVALDGSSLIIKGERPDRPRGVRENYHLAEVPYGTFQRTIEVPVAVDAERASASYRAGMLEIALPKVTQSGTKKVKIKPTP
jgi:HSP20 family protein